MSVNMAADLSLSNAVVTEKLAFLGRTGSGKTYAAQKLAEELHRIGAQFVVLDPVGVWFGLRLAADGKTPGLDVPVLGGLRGDIPLEPTGGALIANLVVDRGTSVILDVSQFESDAAKARFAQDFADRFFFRKKAAPSAVHLFIEECQEFVPQNPQREEARMLHAFTRLVKIGRNFGIGVSLISQRPQEVNKKVLNLAELLFAFQLTGPQERKTIEGWIADKGLDEDIAGELPKLAVGHPHVWSPAWLKISKVVAIAPKKTFDASSTPQLGKASVARELSPIDLEHLRKEMAATIEKAKAEDPRELQKRIRELEGALRKKDLRPAQVTPAPKMPKRVEVPILTDGQVKRLEAVFHGADKLGSRTIVALEAMVKAATEAAKRLEAARKPPAPDLRNLTDMIREQQAGGRSWQEIARRPTAVMVSRPSGGAGDKLPKGERAVLTAIVQHFTTGVTREQLTILTGYKRSTRDTYLQRLREQDLIDQRGEKILPTQAGCDLLGDVEPLPTGDRLREHWLARLPEGERRVLDVLVAAYPKAVDRELISEKTDYARSSRDTYLQRLGARKLIVTEGRGHVRAAEELFG